MWEVTWSVLEVGEGILWLASTKVSECGRRRDFQMWDASGKKWCSNDFSTSCGFLRRDGVLVFPVDFSCSRSSIEKNHDLRFGLYQQIYDDTLTNKSD